MTEYTPGPLLQVAQHTSTALWNDSADLEELTQSISFGGVGATCNPQIAYGTIKKHLDVWAPRIREIAKANPTWGEAEVGWQAVKDMSVEAAALLEPIFKEQHGHNGRLSIQTDPRLHNDAKALADQAESFSQMAPNIIVKVPATSVGVKAIEDATYRGVSINVTVSFSVPQAVRTAEAIQRGLDRRVADGKPIDEMGPVVTIMGGRLDDWLKIVASREQLFIDPGALEWGGIAAIKHAYQIFQERGFQARVLVAAYRNVLQYSELTGGDLVLSPPFAWAKRVNDSGYTPDFDAISKPVPQHHLDALMKMPEFRRAYDPDGMTVEEFDTFGPTVRTLRGFLKADCDLETLVKDIVMPEP
ncbi:transaldolase [Acidipropionibacterium jensenii]|uniref:Transaldolase n=1 Tax=Acidipropionibacterium jensenii TaxID=1749 RepID=A0A3Q9ULX6_9ACTN|nr:transaldolase family protein [Acidipropionibacterium jensenii]AZZ40037.1 transaldolase [Acidipropionibacterium jensenii]